MCVRACPEIFFFLRFEIERERDEDAAVAAAAQGNPSRSRLFFYIYIFRKKKNEKRLLLMLKRRRRLLLLLSFFECITTMPRFFLAPTLPLLSFSFHRPDFLCISFLFFFSLSRARSLAPFFSSFHTFSSFSLLSLSLSNV